MVRIAKKPWLTSVVVVSLVVTLVVTLQPWANAQGNSRRPEVLTIDLTDGIPANPGGNNFELGGVNANGNGAFYINGKVLNSSGIEIGFFQCWGWFNTNRQGTAAFAGMVSQEYDIFGRGKIQTQGAENRGILTIVGGTDEFRNMRGKVLRNVLVMGQRFTITLPPNQNPNP